MARPFSHRVERSPFPPGAPRVPIVHCSHHKTGTGWFRKVLGGVADRYGLKVQRRRNLEPLGSGVDLVLDQGSRGPIQGLTAFRGSHMIRDPRDVAVSAYHYHLWTKEAWAHAPQERYGGKSYQEFLTGLDPIAGLSAEIERCARKAFPRMARWDYGQAEFLELRYEEVIADEAAWFDRLFRHYGFNEQAVETAVSIAMSMSFTSAGRSIGEVSEGTKMRSGRPGQWRDEFTQDHIALFKEHTGDLLIRLGYEKDEHW